MAFRIAVGLAAALRAVLIHGEAAQLTTTPVRSLRLRRAAQSPATVLEGRALS
jgi:hypothetical protein